MSMFTLYMLLKLDAIQIFFAVLMAVSIITVVFSFVALSIEPPEALPKKLIKIFVSLSIIFGIIITIIPSTKEMAFIYVVSKLSQNEHVQGIAEKSLAIPDNALEMLNIKMNEYLNEMKEEVKKEVKNTIKENK